MKRAPVYITRRIPQAGIDLLRASCDVEVNPEDRPLSREELLQEVAGREGVICLLSDRIDAEVYDAAQGIYGFANYAVGYDNIEVGEATRRGLPVTNTPGVLTDATADMAWALLFAVARRVAESDRYLRSGAWEGWGPLQFLGGDLAGTTLGVVGVGRIGTAMALRSKGFGMKVIYNDTRVNDVLEREIGAERVGFDDLVGRSDYISVHVPLMEETVHLFGNRQFEAMKSSAYLINTSRGPVVDESALVAALQRGEIAGAGLDVFEEEPKLAAGLTKLENVVITPHTASATKNTRDNMAIKAAENLLAMIRGEVPPNCINPEVYREQEKR